MAALNRAASRGIKLRDETGAPGLKMEAMEDDGDILVFIKHADTQYFLTAGPDWRGCEVVVFMQRLAFHACAVSPDGAISKPFPFEPMGGPGSSGPVVRMSSSGLHASQSILREDAVDEAGKHWLASAQEEPKALQVADHTGIEGLKLRTLRAKDGSLALLLVHQGKSYTCSIPADWAASGEKLAVFIMRLTFHVCRADTLETREFESVDPSQLPLLDSGLSRHRSMAPLMNRKSSMGLHADQSLLKKDDMSVKLSASLEKKTGSAALTRARSEAPPKAAPGAIGVDTTSPGYETAETSVTTTVIEAALMGAMAMGITMLLLRMRAAK